MNKIELIKSINIAIIVLISMLLTALSIYSPVAHGFDAPPKDQGHSGPLSGNGDPNNPNGPNQGQGGDPIHVRGGNFTTAQEDLLILGHTMPTLIKRSYNSHDNFYEGPFGFGWSFSYNITALEVLDSNGKSQVIIRDGDGVEHVFTHASGDNFNAPNGRYNKLEKIGANSYQITRKDAVKLLFSNSRLDSIVDPNGNQLTLIYAADGKLITVTNPANRTVTLSYGSNNKINKVTDPLGRTVTYVYESNGDLSSFTDTVGNTTQYTYDSKHHLVSVIDPNGTTRLTNTYNSNAQITQQTSDGRTYRYNYQDTYTRVQDPKNKLIYHYFNDQGNTIRRTDQLNNNTYFVYDSDSNLIQETDARGNITKYTYDGIGNIATITDADNKVTTYVTDQNFGVITKITDSLGRSTLYDYDNKGNLIKKKDTLGRETFFEYNAQGQIVKTTDEKSKNLNLAYNTNGDLTSITNHRNEKTQLEYDDVGRRTKLIDPLGHASSYTYDDIDRLVSSTNALNQSLIYSYDKLGNVTRVTDPNGNFVSYVYDQYGLLTSTVDAESNATVFNYDASGNLIKVTDPLGNEQISNFDNANRLLSVTKPDGSITAFAYDKTGNNIRITDPLTNQTNFIYDKLNRLTKTTYADSTTELRSYNAVGNTSIYTDRATKDLKFTYDDLDRVVKQTLPNGDEELIDFDNLGFIKSVVNKYGTINYNFDNADRLASIQDVFGNTFSYQYDAAGRRTKMIDSDGIVTDYKYDNANRLIKVTRQSDITFFSYDDSGRLITRALANGVVSQYTYDKRDLITQLIHKKADNSVLAIYQYVYDVTGKKIQVTEANGSITQYEYDPAYRLLRETKKASDDTIIYDLQHEYDVNGNRTKVIGDSVISYTYNNLDQLVSDGVATYSYDANGNLIKIDEASAITEYQYDDENQLIKVIYPDASELVSKYDAEGKRIEQAVAGQITRFTFDGSAVYSETDSSGVEIAKYNRSLGLISQDRTGAKSYYLTDASGSVRQLVDFSGNASDTYGYDAFGNVIFTTGSTINPYQYAGNWGYYHLGPITHIGARFYKPSIARFISIDPFYQGTNWYSYALNDPINLVDPDGRWIHIGIGAGIGAIVNTGVYLYSTPRGQWSLGGGVRAAATGAIVGGVGAATFGASMPATLGGFVARNALSGLAGQAASDLTNSAFDQKLQISSPWTYAGAIVTDGILGRIGHGFGRAIQKFRGTPRGTCCFVAGTPVLVKEGHKNIEEINIGDLVLAKNIDTGEKDWKPVTKLFKKYREIYELIVVTDNGEKLSIETTDDHPFYIINKGWVNAVDLLSGNLIETNHLGQVKVFTILNSKRIEETFNLEVADFHTYYATKFDLLVHNCGGINNAPKRTGLETRGYKPAPGERTIQGQVDAATKAGNPTVQRGGQDLFRLRSSGHGQSGATATPQNIFRTNPKTGERFGPQAGPDRVVTTRDIRELYKGRTNHGTSGIRTRIGR